MGSILIGYEPICMGGCGRMASMGKTVAFYTFGCRLNQAETARFRRWYLEQGWKEVDWREADRVVVNTCAVTGKAEREVRGFLRRVKRENPKSELWVMGCWINKLKAQNSKLKTIVQNSKLVDNEEKRKMLEEMGSLVDVVKAGYEKAFVKIQEGCDNFCSFCIVPYLRGGSRSEPAELVVSQVKRLVEEGIKWVVLTGVDIAQYRDGGMDLLGLLEQVLEKTGVEKLGLGSIYPTFGLDGGVKRLAELFDRYGERLERRLHISLQSGSESVLRRMGRKTTAKQFAEVVKELRERIPRMVITTDVIVGFPGETEAEFEESLAFVRRMKFDKLHVFRYSPREGTVAAKMLGKKGWEHVPERVVKERAREMRNSYLDRI